MMKFIGLDGKEYKIDTKPLNYPIKSESACRSKIQYACGQYIKEKFPFAPILEDIPVPFHNFYFDFFIPTLRMVFEIDGNQHGEYVEFFHKTKRNFINAKQRDYDKEVLCDKNNWTFIRAKSLDELKEKLDGKVE